MELVFRDERFSYLTEKRYDLIFQEQTAETVLPETMPEIGRILETFGTLLVQSKTVENGSVRVTGGIQVGVLYVPDHEDMPERIEVWVPFAVTKKVPTTDQTTLFYWGWIRSLETRFINSRKIMVKAGIGSELTLLTPTEQKISQLDRMPVGMECKTNTYPMRLPLAEAEKEMQIADEILMPEQLPGIERLLKASCSVEIDESRCIGDKAVYKGDLRIRTLYQTVNGSLAVWNGTVPFSQYAELEREVENGIITIQPLIRHLEIDSDGQPESHRLLLNTTVLAQILVRGTVEVKLTEDAYCLNGELKPEWQIIELTPCLDVLEREITQTIQLPEDAAELLDAVCSLDRFEKAESGSVCGVLRIDLTYFDASRMLKSKLLTQRFRDTDAGEIPGDPVCRLGIKGEVSQTGRALHVPVEANLICLKQMSWQNLSGGEIVPGGKEDGPSLIVRNVNGELWPIARAYRTTVHSICAANQLETEQLDSTRILLIPKGIAESGAEEETE